MASITVYKEKSGRFKGMYHVRTYHDGKYKHVGRFKTKKEAEAAVKAEKAALEGPMSWKRQSDNALHQISQAYK